MKACGPSVQNSELIATTLKNILPEDLKFLLQVKQECMDSGSESVKQEPDSVDQGSVQEPMGPPKKKQKAAKAKAVPKKKKHECTEDIELVGEPTQTKRGRKSFSEKAEDEDLKRRAEKVECFAKLMKDTCELARHLNVSASSTSSSQQSNYTHKAVSYTHLTLPTSDLV